MLKLLDLREEVFAKRKLVKIEDRKVDPLWGKRGQRKFQRLFSAHWMLFIRLL
jgi:hypothetical protein